MGGKASQDDLERVKVFQVSPAIVFGSQNLSAFKRWESLYNVTGKP
jgi:hypothetical protein